MDREEVTGTETGSVWLPLRLQIVSHPVLAEGGSSVMNGPLVPLSPLSPSIPVSPCQSLSLLAPVTQVTYWQGASGCVELFGGFLSPEHVTVLQSSLLPRVPSMSLAKLPLLKLEGIRTNNVSSGWAPPGLHGDHM